MKNGRVMQTRGYNFALVGCGRISGKHAQALESMVPAGSRLVAVCDIDFDKALALGASTGAPAYRCAHQMLKAHPEIDVINILSESGLHARHCIELSAYRKHMVVEKPMALTVADADAMIKACEEAHVRLFVVKQNRYNPAVKALLQAIKEQRFGRIFMVTARVRWARHWQYYNQDAWRGTYELDGGVFANQACHYIDLIQAIMGVPEQVFAKGMTVTAPIEAEDSGIAIFSKGNVIGTLEATTAVRPGNLEGSLTVLGEHGTVELAGVALNEIRIWKFQEPRDTDHGIEQRTREAVDSVYGSGHTDYLVDVVNTLRGEASAAVEGIEGRKTVEILSALYESLATGTEIDVAASHPNTRLGRHLAAKTELAATSQVALEHH